ncbi:MAG: hypothetical protein JWQ43_1550 [Glaciihabitans sp.]|nr:hypothetical protein [Glaciihabitans sp.]
MAFRSSSDRPVITYSIIAVAVFVYLLQMLLGNLITLQLIYYPPFTLSQPWRLLTSVFAHGGILHLLFNMYSLFIFGPVLERMLGRVRFLAMYLLAGLGGSVAVLLLAPTSSVLGASGAIFGLMGAFFVIQRGVGGSSNPALLIVIGLNLVIPFVIPNSNISWQAHVGGLVVGALVAFIYTKTRARRQKTLQIAALVGVAVLLVALILARFALS